ncbi:MAG: MurR/RpiR family transcriptional regulator [Lachnospiraceae bacterium]|jgi:DNA-binding MurR/RpiR family transcriptional regulator|nr:MurR/RpiR family transcriptional regulator [Lachnospiraceae bacterium]
MTAREDSADIMERIRSRYDSMSRKNKILADFITRHAREAVFMTASEMEKHAGVSEPTVVRFAAGLGYGSYSGCISALRACMTDNSRPENSIAHRYSGCDADRILASAVDEDVRKIKAIVESNDAMALDAAAEEILSAERVYLMGLHRCAPLAELLSDYLNICVPGVVLLTSADADELFEKMMHISDRDVMIGISFPQYSLRTIKALEFANDRNAKLISITDRRHSPLNLYTGISLLAQASDPASDSLAAPVALLGILRDTLYAKVPERITKSLHSLEEARRNYEIWQPDDLQFRGDDSLTDFSESLHTTQDREEMH